MSRLTTADKAQCAAYGVLGLAALIGTQIALVRHFTSYEGNDLVGFVENAVINPAAAFGVIDLLAVALVALVFMVVESRRLGVRFLWVYVVLTFVVAISVAFPAFLIARQLRLAEQRAASSGA